MKITTKDGTTYELNSLETQKFLHHFHTELSAETNFSISVKQGIADAFAKRYLKSIGNTTAMEMAAKFIRDEMAKCVSSTFETVKVGRGTWGGSDYQKVLTQDQVKIIRAKVVETVDAEIRGFMEEALEVQSKQQSEILGKLFEAKLKEKVAQAIALGISQLVNGAINQINADATAFAHAAFKAERALGESGD